MFEAVANEQQKGCKERKRLKKLDVRQALTTLTVRKFLNLFGSNNLEAWVHAPASLGLFSAEGGQFVGGHGMSADHRLKTAAGFSEIWDAVTIKRVRAGDGTVVLPGRRLAMHMLV